VRRDAIVGAMQVFRIPFSTNVERVALALGHKGVAAEWVDVDPSDRTPVRELSGQELVPVLVEDDGRVTADSTAILRRLEQLYPEPPLWPRDEARRAQVDVFVDWFNRVWKRPPNLLADEPGRPDERALAEELRGSLDLFEALLAGRDHLFGDFSAADCAAFPFLRYALRYDPTDDDPFHQVLIEQFALAGSHPRLEEWIRRVDARPRA
jgi:glutathione S-transferase